MIKWLNTPFSDVIQAAENLYGEIDCELAFTYLENEDHAGVAIFPDDGSLPTIEIDVLRNSIAEGCATIAHEIAHIVVGHEQQHNEKFEACEAAIQEEYNRYCAAKYNKEVQ